MAVNFGRELSKGEWSTVSEAIKKAVKLCDLVIDAGDGDLGTKLADLKVTQWRKSPSRTKGVQDDFKKIKDALEQLHEDSFGVKAGDPGEYAEVDPKSPYKITLLQQFWNASDKGADSKAGVLIHEASHWEIVRGTDDHAYGKKAGKLSFTLSRNNADTLEAIAESYDK